MGILLDKLTEYGNSDFYPYHMPGHKRHTMPGFPQEITNVDITEISDFDNLHQPEGILLEAQERAAAAYGAEESFFLVNGSTCGILSAISAAVPFGGHLLIARNCHKSVYHAAYLRHLQLSYIYPAVMPEFDICEAVTAEQVEAKLQEDASILAVLVVSPTYEGRIADIKAIAEVVHAKGLPLIVDEAHGAHLGFCEGFALNSSMLGADLVINSVHKTLPAMTQTALLHCNGGLIDRDALKRFLHIYQSSSPSYIMMASIDHAVQTAVERTDMFRQFRADWLHMLRQLEALQKIQILPAPKAFERMDRTIHDIGKLVISTKGTDISGKQLVDILRERYHLEMEMACETYVLAMFTMADTGECYERLIQALLEIDGLLVKSEAELLEAGNLHVTNPDSELLSPDAEAESPDAEAKSSDSEAVSSDSELLNPDAEAENPDAEAENADAEAESLDSEAVATEQMEVNRQKATSGQEALESIPFYQAWEYPKQHVSLDDAEGRFAGEFINLYPPGTPIAVPGEVITHSTIEQIKNCIMSGLEVQGVRDQSYITILLEENGKTL